MNKFKKGDIVTCINHKCSGGLLLEGHNYQVESAEQNEILGVDIVRVVGMGDREFCATRFRLKAGMGMLSHTKSTKVVRTLTSLPKWITYVIEGDCGKARTELANHSVDHFSTTILIRLIEDNIKEEVSNE